MEVTTLSSHSLNVQKEFPIVTVFYNPPELHFPCGTEKDLQMDLHTYGQFTKQHHCLHEHLVFNMLSGLFGFFKPL